jgi:predicted phosphodiesterase
MSGFSFIVVTDSHVSGKPDREDDFWWNRVLVSRGEEILREAVKEINARAPDFVVHCGDLTNDGHACSFRAAREALQGLTPRLHFAPGNHDSQEAESRGAMGEALGLDGGPCYDVVRIADWRVIVIDAVYWTLRDGTEAEYRVAGRFVNMTVPTLEMDWLRAELGADGDTPTLCFLHPFPCVREQYPAKKMAGPYGMDMVEGFRRGSVAATAEVKGLLGQHACVKAVFSGHGHWHECLVEDGVLFCQTGALAEYPCEMREVRVWDDRIETEVFGLGSDTYARMSYVEEAGNRWVAGREIDRRMTHRL